jgi:hypothetical protein
MDFITTLPETKANHHAVMVIVDKLTRLVIVNPYQNRYGHGNDSEAVLQSLV